MSLQDDAKLQPVARAIRCAEQSGREDYTESIPLSGDRSTTEMELNKKEYLRNTEYLRKKEEGREGRNVNLNDDRFRHVGARAISLIFGRRERLGGYVHVRNPEARVGKG